MFQKVVIVFMLVVFFVTGCGQAVGGNAAQQTSLPTIVADRHPAPADFSIVFGEKTPVITKYDPNSTDPEQNDFRSMDLSALDLSQSGADLLYASFDNQTKWPPADKMPADFDWQQIMETGKNPGLGMRKLHQQGITGQGIGIAIVDQPLLLEHQEYRERLKLYEEINIEPQAEAAMHGAAVASIAVGKTVGVAPKADLYYIGAWTGDWNQETNEFIPNFKYYARALRRILEINQTLPESGKIRVVAMQVGWDSSQTGYDDITAAVEQAKAAGVFVISSSLEETYGLAFHGLGRDPLGDADDFSAYTPGLWWSQQFYAGKTSPTPRLMVPMDARTTASPTGADDYVYYRSGGWSWSIPYLAASYALAAQVKPEITPDQFWQLALQTGQTIQIEREGESYSLGVILDPQALIRALQK